MLIFNSYVSHNQRVPDLAIQQRLHGITSVTAYGLVSDATLSHDDVAQPPDLR